MPHGHLPVAQDQEGGDGPDRESLRDLRRIIYVDLHELDLPGKLAGQALQRLAHHLARRAPRRPQIDQHREVRTLRDLMEAVIASFGDPGQRPLAATAARNARTHRWHPVRPTTPLAWHNCRCQHGARPLSGILGSWQPAPIRAASPGRGATTHHSQSSFLAD
jgi:hypothetical protein